MEQLHAIAGLPRTGSTLLCNLLAQNPQFYVSSTSHLPAALMAATRIHTQSFEIRGHLIRDRHATEARLEQALRGYCQGWYAAVEQPVVFDKSRTWNLAAPLLRRVFPEARLIVCVRDLCEVFASIERHHLETALFDENGATQFARADALFEPKGLIGECIEGVQDLIRRGPALENVTFIRHEDLSRDPTRCLGRLYDDLGRPPYDHDVGNVQSTAREVDGLYWHKFPHDGSGAVCEPDQSWKRYISEDIRQLVRDRFALYNREFRYG